jgi:hypothetical protein
MIDLPPHSQQSFPVGNNSDSPRILVGGAHQGNQDTENKRHWMLKMEFPQFIGSHVRVWLDKCAS